MKRPVRALFSILMVMLSFGAVARGGEAEPLRFAQPPSDQPSSGGAGRVERELYVAALNTLDYFLRAGLEKNVPRGAELLTSFYVDSRRAITDTRRLFKDNQSMLSAYRSVSRDIYGYAFSRNLRGVSVEIEGGIETDEGVTSEFSARMVYRHNRWLISELDID
ncbi:hypothetical protein [Pelagicoccus sp. SDUM812003]|uniref:hypothetical protein n=1 Tax=Pelagicoccus sp. SDUM812003 TaxID=3041267 RepID=UPI002810277C|nr:hypothetical protein [Pelagicoccus sp. SDUM812003]MDQ8204076.1 hypothetical protein [Pelagicoccus sp. SDUM812003]